MSHRPPPPAPIDGTDPISFANALLVIRLSLRHGPRSQRILAGVLAVVALATAVLGVVVFELPWWMVPVLLIATAALFVHFVVYQGKRWAVGYFDATATQMVRPRGDTWELSDHLARERGRGLARPFRRRVFADLARQADALGVPIVMDTSVWALRQMYLDDMPGLAQVGTTPSKRLGRQHRQTRAPGQPPPDGTTLYRLRREPQNNRH